MTSLTSPFPMCSMLIMTGFQLKKMPSYSSADEAIKARRQSDKNLTEEAAVHLVERGLVPEAQSRFTWRTDQQLISVSGHSYSEEQVLSILESMKCPTILILGKQGYRLLSMKENRGGIARNSGASDVFAKIDWDRRFKAIPNMDGKFCDRECIWVECMQDGSIPVVTICTWIDVHSKKVLPIDCGVGSRNTTRETASCEKGVLKRGVREPRYILYRISRIILLPLLFFFFNVQHTIASTNGSQKRPHHRRRRSCRIVDGSCRGESGPQRSPSIQGNGRCRERILQYSSVHSHIAECHHRIAECHSHTTECHFRTTAECHSHIDRAQVHITSSSPVHNSPSTG